MSEDRAGREPSEPDDLELDDEPEEDLDPDLESDPEDTEPDPEAEPEPESPAPSRSQQRRVRREQQELRELREANRRLTEALTRQPAQPQYQTPLPDPARQAALDQQERDRVAQMPFEEQGRYWADKRFEEARRHAEFSALQTRDMLDQQNFKQIMREERYPARYATEVESLLSQARQMNMNPTREYLLDMVIGREVRAKKGRATEQARQRGQRRIASQTVRPGGRGSTAAAPAGRRGQNQDAEDEALLRSVTWGEVNR